MAFRLCFVIGGFLFFLFTCHSAPVVNVNPKVLVASPTSDQKPSDTDKSSSVSPVDSTTSTSTLASERKDPKQKREINEDQIDLDEFFTDDKNDDLYPYPILKDDDKNENERILFTDVKESPAKQDETLDLLDDNNLFSDLQMNPAELSTILHQRRRRDVKLVDPLNQRRKRSLSSYGLYSSESFDDPWANFVDEQRYVRPLRSFAPIYWYPPNLERSVRSYDHNSWPIEYGNPLVNDADDDDDDENDDDDDDDDEIPITIYEQDDSDDDYEQNRYPMLMKSYSFPYDNLQYQTSYSNVGSPFDDSDEDSLAIIDGNVDDDDDSDNDEEDEFPILYEQERPTYMHYDPIENYIDV